MRAALWFTGLRRRLLHEQHVAGAELANLLNEATINAARTGERAVRWGHLDAARDRMLLGKERQGFRALDTGRATVAYHEAGHALAGVLCAPEDGLHKVTIQPRGQAMGVAYFSPSDDRDLYRRSYLEALIMKGLAGRAAEELVFGHGAITSGAQSDLQQVNGIARKMVYQLGMGHDTGLLIHDGEMGCPEPRGARADGPRGAGNPRPPVRPHPRGDRREPRGAARGGLTEASMDDERGPDGISVRAAFTSSEASH